MKKIESMPSIELPSLSDYKFVRQLCRVPEQNYTRPLLLEFMILKDPEGYEGKHVVRLIDTHKLTPFITVRNTLEEARETIPKGLTRIMRGCFDPKEVVETWY